MSAFDNQSLGGGSSHYSGGGPGSSTGHGYSQGGSDFLSNFNNFNNNVVGQVVSSELINNIYEKQRDRWTPGATSLWASLKEYFDVSNQFVFSKIKLVLYPLSQNSWQRLRRDDMSSSIADTSNQGQGVSKLTWAA